MKPEMRTLQKDGRNVVVAAGGEGEKRLLDLGYAPAADPVEAAESDEIDPEPTPDACEVEEIFEDEKANYLAFLNAKTKTQIKDYAAQEFLLELDVNRNKQELIDIVIEAAEKAVQEIQEEA